MASLTYNGSASQTTAYAASDVYTLNVAPSAVTNVSQQGANVVIQTGSTALTITGVTLAQLATANFALQNGGSVIIGDGTADTAADAGANSLTGTANGDILLGLGGSDAIVGNNGDNLIFGGSGVFDSTDDADVITSGTGNDRIYGNAGGDNITSGSGSDVVFGGLGADSITVNPLSGQTATVYGGGAVTDTTDSSNDTINVGATNAQAAGNAAIYGNAGADTLNVFSTGNNSVYGGIGNDTIAVNGNGANLVYGNADSDSITITGNGNNTVYGGSQITDTVDGADTISVNGTGNNTIYANAGADTVTLAGTIATSQNTVFLGAGNDTVNVTGAGSATVYGNGDSDTLTIGGTGNNTVYGGSGVNDATDAADTINVTSTGNNAIYGNGGNDTINLGTVGGNLGANTVYGGGGNDTIVVSGGQAAFGFTAATTTTVYGNDGSDIIDLRNLTGSATVFGGSSINDSADTADTIRGGASNTLVYGNGGDDLLTTGTGTDTLFGGAGQDRFVVNGLGNKVIGDYTGGSVADRIVVTTGAALTDVSLDATSGTRAVGNDAVLVIGGAQAQTITFTGAANSLVVTEFGTFDAATDTLQAATGTTKAYLQLGVTNANITGTTAAELIVTGSGNDSVVSGGGADTISLGAGNDQLVVSTAQLATATLNGGDGNDTLFVNTGATVVIGGTVTNFENITFDTGTYNVSGFVAGATGTSVINGANTTALTFSGTGGNISVTGGAGGDTLTTGAGNDTLVGGAGVDVLNAGNGTNLFIGGTGADQMTAGTGVDTFRFAAGDSGTPAAANFDAIATFGSNQDIIDYTTSITFQATTAPVAAGTASIGANGIAAFDAADTTFDARLAAVSNAINAGTNTAGETAIFTQGGNSYVFISDGVNGVGANDVLIQLTGVTATAGSINASGDLLVTI